MKHMISEGVLRDQAKARVAESLVRDATEAEAAELGSLKVLDIDVEQAEYL